MLIHVVPRIPHTHQKPDKIVISFASIFPLQYPNIWCPEVTLREVYVCKHYQRGWPSKPLPNSFEPSVPAFIRRNPLRTGKFPHIPHMSNEDDSKHKSIILTGFCECATCKRILLAISTPLGYDYRNCDEGSPANFQRLRSERSCLVSSSTSDNRNGNESRIP